MKTIFNFVSFVLILCVQVNFVYAEQMTSDELPAVRCALTDHVSSFACAGSYCDNITIECESDAYEEIGTRFNTTWVENAGL